MSEEPKEAPWLAELAEYCGIELQFRDAGGAIRHTPIATLRRLLAAMGIAAENETEAEASLTQLEAAEWERALPPVCVAQRNKGPAALEIVLPAELTHVRWRLDLETGGALSGTIGLAQLTLLARRVSRGVTCERRRLILDLKIPDGYHTLTLPEHAASTPFIMSPGQCWLPERLHASGRIWGVAAQLYAVRSHRNWGIGDFTDLRQLMSMSVAQRADILGVNPLHALFPDEPTHASPYSPASRLLLNILYIDVEAIPELAACAPARQMIASSRFRRELQRARAGSLIDYEWVTSVKRAVLGELYRHFDEHAPPERATAFAAFRAAQTSSFERACVFTALREHFSTTTGTHDWHHWPAPYRDAESGTAAHFAREHADAVTEVAWLQWIADEQLRAASRVAPAMCVGLYRDLAVGADPSGAETWSNPGAFVAGVCVGAPPDLYNPAGQNWGLPALNPQKLCLDGFRSFIEVVRANMRHCGALRIDHAMALLHVYWVPQGAGPAEGAYVRYAFEDLLGILALESQRQHCVVIGEDLGTVPEGFRERMARSRALSYRILFFERDAAGGLLPPEEYPHLAVAMVGSHDLPTLRAWWEGTDLDLRDRLHLYPSRQAARAARRQRGEDRTHLLTALYDANTLEHNTLLDWRALLWAVHDFLARSTAAIAMAQLDDVTGEREPVNVPGTCAEYPNWRRRYSVALEDLPTYPLFEQVATVLSARVER